jgi:hypothetical protein
VDMHEDSKEGTKQIRNCRVCTEQYRNVTCSLSLLKLQILRVEGNGLTELKLND